MTERASFTSMTGLPWPPPGPTRRYLALWFPFLPVDRLRREERRTVVPDEPPLVLCDMERGAMRIAALSPAARAEGLTVGMTLADARARLPALRAEPIERRGDAERLLSFADMAEMFTPLVAPDGEDGLLLDVTGCAHLFGGEDRLLTIGRRCFERLGFATRAVIAETPEAAHALVRFGTPGRLAQGETERAARALPVSALEAGAETTIALVRAGLRTLGDLADRPSALLSARFGEALSHRLRRILGREDIRITPRRPLPDCMAERHFPEPLTDEETLGAVVTRLAQDVCGILEARGGGGRRFTVDFFRCDGMVRRLTLETGAPCRDPTVLLRLYRLRLDSLASPLDPGFGFDAVRLAVPALEDRTPTQVSLDSRAAEAEDVAALIDRLVTRFGRDHVLAFVAGDSHDPTLASRLAPIAKIGTRIGAEAATSSIWPRPDAGEPPTRPLQLFTPPQPIEALAEVPDGPPLRFRWRRILHEVARAEGPERIAPDWWLDEPVFPETRDYYRLEDRDGRRFWVYREGLYGEDGRPRWYLHGLFP